MKPHYVCTGGCGGMSGTPINCKTYSCPNYQKPMVECHCIDWRHEELLQKKDDTLKSPQPASK